MRLMPNSSTHIEKDLSINHSGCPFLAATAGFYVLCCRIIISQKKNFVIKPVV